MGNGQKLFTEFFIRLAGTALKKSVVLVFLLFGINDAIAQDIPLGQWESHFNYLSAKYILSTDNKIFCASYNGLFSVNTTDKQIKILSKADGLSGTGISSMAYDEESHTMLLAYRTGNLDLLVLNQNSEPDQIVSWPVFDNAVDLPDHKQINRIVIHKNLAYLATNFGIVILDTKLQQVRETYRYIGTNGAELNVKDIAFASDSIYAFTNQGILVSSMNPTVNRQYFANWKVLPGPFPVSGIVSLNNAIYGGLSGKGIYKLSQGKWIMVYSSVSNYYSFHSSENGITATLQNSIVYIPLSGQPQVFQSSLFSSIKESIFTDAEKIWSADENQGLFSNVDGDFKTYRPAQSDTTLNPRTDSTVIDLNGLFWTRLPAYLGGGLSVKNKTTNQERFLNTAASNGGLPSSTINSLAMDQDGFVWFASDRGAGYFLPDDILTNSRRDAILPVFGQRRLFSNEKCTALAVEPGNRKWIGTLNGLYLFNADGTEMLQHFTEKNSPLPSDLIIALRFEPETGMLFVDTPNGMVSYRTNSTAAAENFSSVVIFPNPVRPGYGGQVGFKGLANNSTVKITQLSGRLVYETRSEGGTASWNLNDYTGNRARGGIYMVLIVSASGDQKFAGKLAIID